MFQTCPKILVNLTCTSHKLLLPSKICVIIDDTRWSGPWCARRSIQLATVPRTVIQDASRRSTIRQCQRVTARYKHQELLVCVILLWSVSEGTYTGTVKMSSALSGGNARRCCHFPVALVSGYQALLLFHSLSRYLPAPLI